MNKKVSPTLIGAFVVGALALAVIALLMFGSGRLFRNTREFILYFDSSVNGLRVGAPVKFRGVEIGSVKNILLQVEKNMRVEGIPVIIEIDLEKLTRRGASGDVVMDPKAFEEAIDRGLRAQLALESFVTGVRYIGFDVFPGSPARFVQAEGSKYQEIPTIPTTFERTEDAVVQILAKLSEIDFKGLAESAGQTIDGVNKLVNAPELRAALQSLEKTMPKLDEAVVNIKQAAATIDGSVKTLSDDLGKTSTAARRALAKAEDTMKEAEATMTSVRAVLDPDSPTFYELTRSLKEVAAAARSLRLLASYVERNPRALVFGKPAHKED
jgi:paraquat-inducible protein B